MAVTSETLADPMPSPFVLRALRRMPAFRGKARIARALLTKAEKNSCTLIRDGYGNRMVLPNLIEPVGFSLGVDGRYEPEVVDLLRSQLNRDADFIDVGANIGAFTLALAGHARRVLAIEASPVVLAFLRRNIELSGRENIELADCAASAPGVDTVPFYMPPMDHFGMGSSAAQFDVQPIEIQARSLDGILGEKPWNVTAMKVDVEGFEPHVFLGAANLLRAKRAPLVVFEFCDWAEERAFPGRKGWGQEILLEAGYSLWLLPDYLRKAKPMGKPVREGFHTIVARKM